MHNAYWVRLMGVATMANSVTNSTYLLCLQLAQVPRLQDLVIFLSTATMTTTSLAHAHRVKTGSSAFKIHATKLTNVPADLGEYLSHKSESHISVY